MQRITTISVRLKKYMEIFHLRQVDIVEMVKPYAEEQNIVITKASISQYVSGHTEPNDIRYKALSLALGVNELWLRGYNVDQEGNELQDVPDQAHPSGFSSRVDPDTGHTVISIPSDALAHAVEMSTNEKRYIISQSISMLSDYDLDSLLMIIDRMKGRPGQ